MQQIEKKALYSMVSHLRALSDLNENIIIYKAYSPENEESKKNPFEVVKIINSAHENLTTVLKIFEENSTKKQYLLSASFDKSIKLWDISGEPKLLNSM